ncbi:MAG: cell division ATPase MinD [Candidatus Hadarchaeota archaeon]
MRSIALVSGKGGVGRTTIVANLGLALADMGKNVIIMDGSFATPDLALHFTLEKSVYTLNDVLSGDATLDNVIYVGSKGLRIAPAAVTLEQIRKTHPERLPEAMKQVPAGTDFVIVDAPGGLRRETVASIRATKETVLVATPDTISVSDCMKTRLVAEFLGSSPMGVILNRVTGAEFELDKNEIKEIMNLSILGEIPEDAAVAKALNQGKPLLESSPNSPAARAIVTIARKLVKGGK